MKKMTSICVLLLMLPVVARCLRIAPAEGTDLTENQDDNVNIKHEYQREKRSGNTNLNPRQNCSTWSPWINRHHPKNGSDPNDRENVSRQEMDTFCPPQHGGRVSNISCKDGKGEPFFGNQTGASKEFFVSCYSPFVGVECVYLKQPQQVCPDMSMKYFCSCSNDTSVTSSPGLSTTTKHQLSTLKHGMSTKHMSSTTKHQLSTLKHGMSSKHMSTTTKHPLSTLKHGMSPKHMSSTTKHQLSTLKHGMSSKHISTTTKHPLSTLKQGMSPKHMSTTTKHQLSTLKQGMSAKQAEKQDSSPTDGFNAGRLFVPWWTLYLLIALVLFSVCMCTIVCMYRHLKKKLRDGKHGPKVHPTA